MGSRARVRFSAPRAERVSPRLLSSFLAAFMRLMILPRPGLLLAAALACFLSSLSAQVTTTRREVFGRVQLYSVDHLDGSSCGVVHMLEELDGDRKPTGVAYRILFDHHNHPGLRSGDIVLARGDVTDGDLALAIEPEIALDPGDAGSVIEIESMLAPSTTSSGVLVILCDFTDKSLSASCTVQNVDSFLLSGAQSVSGLYQESSFGQHSFHGDVVGPYTIPYQNAGSCDYYGYASAAEAAAIADCHDLGGYRHRVYVLPNIAACSWAGLGSIGGYPSRAWIKRCDLPDVFAHEIGHNVGMMHSGTGTNEYGDRSCIMGYGGVGWRQFNAPHKIEMGWLPATRHHVLTRSETLTLAPLEAPPDVYGLAPDTPQVLEVPANGSTEDYYLSYRVPYGLETDLRSDYSYQVNVHRWAGNGQTSWLVATLEDGESYTTPQGVTITQLGHSGTGATVAVDLGGAAFPGNGADTATEIRIDGIVSEGTSGIHAIQPGSLATFDFLSPGGALDGQPFAVACSVFTTGSLPAGVPHIGLWIDPTAYAWLVNGFATPGILLNPGGFSVGPFAAPPDVAGTDTSLILQVLTLTGGVGLSDGAVLTFL